MKARIYSLLDYNPKILDKEIFVNNLISNLCKTSVGFAGFKNKKYLKNHLQLQLFDNNDDKELPKYFFNNKKIFKIVNNTLSKCQKKLPSKPSKIFLFPTFNSFIKNKMNGVSGFSPQANTILIYLNPSRKNWETALKHTITHEYNHSVVYNFHKWKSLLDSIIFEGFAENFREQVVGGERSPWTKAVSPEECKKYFSNLKEKLNLQNHQLEREVFFGSNNYPLWLGYSLGYQIVKSFLNKSKEKYWSDIIKANPKKILKQSNF